MIVVIRRLQVTNGAGERPAKAISPALGLRLLSPPPLWRTFARRASQCSKKAHGALPYVPELVPMRCQWLHVSYATGRIVTIVCILSGAYHAVTEQSGWAACYSGPYAGVKHILELFIIGKKCSQTARTASHTGCRQEDRAFFLVCSL